MRRHLPALLALVVGLAAGYLIANGRAQPPQPRPPEPVDFTADISVRYGHDNAHQLRPHHVTIDNQTRRVGPIPESAPAGVWIVRLDNGRVQIACTDVTPP